MTGRHALIVVLAMLVFAGLQPAPAQQPDAFERANCEKNFLELRGEVEKRGKAIEAAGKRKADAKEACGLLRNFAAAESRMIKYLKEKQSICGIPDQLVEQASAAHSKSLSMRNQVCKVAAGPPAPPPPPPSQGLSGALGTPGVGGPPAGTAGGSGVFDTLTGNVLRQ